MSDAFISLNIAKRGICNFLMNASSDRWFYCYMRQLIFKKIITLILIDINNNIILHSYGDLLSRKYLHISNVSFWLDCWEKAWAHSISYVTDEDHRPGWFQAMNLVQVLWLHTWDRFHCALGSLLKIIVIYTFHFKNNGLYFLNILRENEILCFELTP